LWFARCARLRRGKRQPLGLGRPSIPVSTEALTVCEHIFSSLAFGFNDGIQHIDLGGVDALSIKDYDKDSLHEFTHARLTGG